MWEESERGAKFVVKMFGLLLLGIVLGVAATAGLGAGLTALLALTVLGIAVCVLWTAACSLIIGVLAAVSRPFRRAR